MLRKKTGQSTLEYALIIAVVIAALIAIQVYMRRSVTGRLRSSSDQIGDQYGVKTYDRAITTWGGESAHAGTTTTHETRVPASDGGILSNITAGETIESQQNDVWTTN